LHAANVACTAAFRDFALEVTTKRRGSAKTAIQHARVSITNSGTIAMMTMSCRSDSRMHIAAAAVTAFVCVALSGAAHAQRGTQAAASAPKAASSGNRYNDLLLDMKPEQRAARLARFVGPTCIGTDPFLMGLTKNGRAKGYAYWSLNCAGDKSYMIQVAPSGEVAAMDCQTLKQNGEGRECFKTF
jgi:hypothetical protein